MTQFRILNIISNESEIISSERYSVTVIRNAATNQVIEAYFEILPSGRKFDGLTFRLFINGVERRFLEDM